MTKQTKATTEVTEKESVLRVITDIFKGEKMVVPLNNMALKRKNIEGPIQSYAFVAIAVVDDDDYNDINDDNEGDNNEKWEKSSRTVCDMRKLIVRGKAYWMEMDRHLIQE